jgi:formiminotetrahydrofolate cyclodeaminase
VETLERYLHELASAEPVPGGGSAAAIVASIAAALVGMVARICERNPKYADRADVSGEVVAESDALRERLDAARIRDEDAFASVVAAQELPKDTAELKAARQAALAVALRAAAQEPLETAALALGAARLADRILQIPNKNLASDVGCAAEFAIAALAACAYNVRVNHRYMRDEATVLAQAQRLADYEREGAQILARVRTIVGGMLAR